MPIFLDNINTSPLLLKSTPPIPNIPGFCLAPSTVKFIVPSRGGSWDPSPNSQNSAPYEHHNQKQHPSYARYCLILNYETIPKVTLGTRSSIAFDCSLNITSFFSFQTVHIMAKGISRHKISRQPKNGTFPCLNHAY